MANQRSRWLTGHFGFPDAPELLIREYACILMQALLGGIVAALGVIELITMLSEGRIPFALASSSSGPVVETVLAGLGPDVGLYSPSGIDHLLDVPVDLLGPVDSRGPDIECLRCRSGRGAQGGPSGPVSSIPGSLATVVALEAQAATVALRYRLEVQHFAMTGVAQGSAATHASRSHPLISSGS